MKNKFYITTPIYYINDVPHIGHAYTTVMCDIIKRYKTLTGHEVFFLTGTDEHGQKIEESAGKQNLSPQQLADKVVVRFKDLWEALHIDYDKFIRTTDSYHVEGVKKIFKKVMDKGDIYAGDYEGHYCVSDESFVTDMAEDSDDGNKICPDCGKVTQKVTEKCYFFRLSAYQDKLLKFYEDNPDFIQPKSRMNEVVSFVKMGLRDLSVTRSTVKWGISVPGDDEQTIYVWFDALTNYINAINYNTEDETFKKFWPADLHVIGKDILKFHAVYWPAFLMAADLPLPKMELVHGWWLKDNKKMSKSIGNVLDPNILLEHFNPDAIKYFLMREAPIGADGNFSHEGFIGRINTDLANDWGNLISRADGMVGKYFKHSFDIEGVYGEKESAVKEAYLAMEKETLELFNAYKFNRGLEKIFEYIGSLNRYIVEAEPWEMAKSEEKKAQLAAVMKTLVRAILSVNALLSPVLSDTAVKVREIFNYPETGLGWKDPGETFTINKGQQLFPRVDIKDFLGDDAGTGAEPKKEKKAKKQQKPQKQKKDPVPQKEGDGLIGFEDFMKVQLTAAQVLKAEKHPNADKLLVLTVDSGTDERTLVAGIALYYEPEDLVGKKIIIVKNLKPAKLRGVLSQGMILAASKPGERMYLPFLPEETPVGALVK
ncbi:MAG: methionine--tRNA ligase [bacterium]|nr:methionine--tRNA ligase [bacterium]